MLLVYLIYFCGFWLLMILVGNIIEGIFGFVRKVKEVCEMMV